MKMELPVRSPGRGPDRTPGMLASVTSVAEAEAALAAGADLIDLKEPARGALGALDLDTVVAIVAAVGGRRPVSATVLMPFRRADSSAV